MSVLLCTIGCFFCVANAQLILNLSSGSQYLSGRFNTSIGYPVRIILPTWSIQNLHIPAWMYVNENYLEGIPLESNVGDYKIIFNVTLSVIHGLEGKIRDSSMICSSWFSPLAGFRIELSPETITPSALNLLYRQMNKLLESFGFRKRLLRISVVNSDFDKSLSILTFGPFSATNSGTLMVTWHLGCGEIAADDVKEIQKLEGLNSGRPNHDIANITLAGTSVRATVVSWFVAHIHQPRLAYHRQKRSTDDDGSGSMEESESLEEYGSGSVATDAPQTQTTTVVRQRRLDLLPSFEYIIGATNPGPVISRDYIDRYFNKKFHESANTARTNDTTYFVVTNNIDLRIRDPTVLTTEQTLYFRVSATGTNGAQAYLTGSVRITLPYIHTSSEKRVFLNATKGKFYKEKITPFDLRGAQKNIQLSSSCNQDFTFEVLNIGEVLSVQVTGLPMKSSEGSQCTLKASNEHGKSADITISYIVVGDEFTKHVTAHLRGVFVIVVSTSTLRPKELDLRISLFKVLHDTLKEDIIIRSFKRHLGRSTKTYVVQFLVKDIIKQTFENACRGAGYIRNVVQRLVGGETFTRLFRERLALANFTAHQFNVKNIENHCPKFRQGSVNLWKTTTKTTGVFSTTLAPKRKPYRKRQAIQLNTLKFHVHVGLYSCQYIDLTAAGVKYNDVYFVFGERKRASSEFEWLQVEKNNASSRKQPNLYICTLPFHAQKGVHTFYLGMTLTPIRQRVNMQIRVIVDDHRAMDEYKVTFKLQHVKQRHTYRSSRENFALQNILRSFLSRRSLTMAIDEAIEAKSCVNITSCGSKAVIRKLYADKHDSRTLHLEWSTKCVSCLSGIFAARRGTAAALGASCRDADTLLRLARRLTWRGAAGRDLLGGGSHSDSGDDGWLQPSAELTTRFARRKFRVTAVRFNVTTPACRTHFGDPRHISQLQPSSEQESPDLEVAADSPLSAREAATRKERRFLLNVVVPACAVVVVGLVVALLVACFLNHRRRTRQYRAALPQQQHEFRNHGTPVILADELEEKPLAPSKPLILPNEKPPLHVPEFSFTDEESTFVNGDAFNHHQSYNNAQFVGMNGNAREPTPLDYGYQPNFSYAANGHCNY